MKKRILLFIVAAMLCVFSSSSIAQTNFFEDVLQKDLLAPFEVTKNINNIRVLQLDEQAMRAYLLKAPMEFQNNGVTLPLEIPLPNGQREIFQIVESPILSPEVAAQHPEIKTYSGNGTINKKATIRLSLNSGGFNAIILNLDNDAVYFQKYSEQSPNVYFNYFTRDVVAPQKSAQTKICGFGQHRDKHDHERNTVSPFNSPEAKMMGEAVQLRTYRLAVAATGEFTAQHGGTQASAFTVVVEYVNRMTALYRRELAVSFTLVSGQNLIYTDAATDPYDNENQEAMLEENHTNCNTVIGPANYDVGHVWGYVGGSGGGIAAEGSVCDGGVKGEGVSGEGDIAEYAQVFFDQLFFHEVGHQFGMNHSYNSVIPVCTTRNPDTSVEPGAGATIMSYGFTCDGDDYFTTATPLTGPILQFHAANLAEANAFLIAGGTCVTPTATGNTTPDVTVPGNFTIPRSTPFALTGSATDVNNDGLTYCWEGMNIGVVEPDANTLLDPTQPPFFRSYGMPDSSSATRIYPRLSAILNGTNTAKGDKLPSVGISTTHRLTVRDNNAAGGGVSFADVTVNIDGSIGPFLETTNLSGSYAGFSNQNITWDVSGTSTATPNVNILLSTDGGQTFPHQLVMNTANDGNEMVMLPNEVTSQARIKVEAVGNIFFDISNVNFSITASLPVEMLYFKGEGLEKGNLLKWATESEENNAGFEIQKSIDGRSFDEIDFVYSDAKSYEQKVYEYFDKDVTGPVAYYRLKQIDFDGRFEYSNIVAINRNNAAVTKLLIFPNPVQDVLTIENGEGFASVYNILGQLYQQFEVNDSKYLFYTNNLPKGIYVLQIRKPDGTAVAKEFLK